MVNTGSTYSFIPASMLRELGIIPTRTMGFRLANGQEIDYEVGRVVLRINGYAEVTPVCFGQDGNTPLIGVVTLEELGLAVDPAGRRLIDLRPTL